MAWDSSPPTKEEIKKTTPSWDSRPPTDDELTMIESRNGNELMAATTGLANGATFGYLPQIEAAIERPIAQAIDFVAGTKIADEYPKSYVERRDEAATRHKELKDNNPWSYGVANVAGGIGSGVLIPVGNLGKAATVGKKIKEGAKIGALFGAVQNPGETRGEMSPFQLGDRAINAGLGAGFGALVPTALNAPTIAKSAGKRFLTTKLGVPEESINEYLKRPNEINSAPTVEQLRDEVFDIVKGISDKYHSAEVSAKEASTAVKALKDRLSLQLQNEKLSAKDAFKEAERIVEASIQRAKNESATDIVSNLGNLKEKISKGSSESYAILEKDPQGYSVRSAGGVLRKIADEMNIQPYAENAITPLGSIRPGSPLTNESAAAQKTILDLAARLEATPEKVPAKELKKILQQIDNSGKVLYGTPGFDGDVAKAYKMVRGVIDDAVKKSNPEYAAKMKEVAENTGLYNEAAKMFGTEPQALSTLNTVNGALGAPKRELLKKFQSKVGQDYLNHITPEKQAGFTEMISKQKAFEGMQKPGYLDQRMDDLVNASPELQWSKYKDSALKKAEEKLAPFKSISPNSAGQTTIQSKINTVMGDRNIEARRMFDELSKLGDRDFVKTINDMRIKGSFEKGFQNGSSNVNFWATVGGFIGSPFGVQGAAAGITGGAALGKYLDKFGPRVAKQILDGVIKMKGKPTYQAISKFNIPDAVKNELAKDLTIFETQVGPKIEGKTGTTGKITGGDSNDPDARKPSSVPFKGETRWAIDGIGKINQHDKSGLLQNPALVEDLLNSKDGMNLLIQASDLKPGSKAMENLLQKIKSRKAKGAKK